MMHLRATAKPEASRTSKGRFVVWTECGLRTDAVNVDNEKTTCPVCARADT